MKRALITTMVLLLLTTTASGTVVVHDKFDAPAGTVNKGRAPAPVNTLGATWSEPGTSTTLNGSGQAVQTGNTTCFLPFQFTDPGTYVLSASLAHPSSAGGQIYLGFASTDYTSGDHYGQAWQYGGAMVQFSGNGGITLFYNNPPHESNPTKAGVNVGGGKTDTFTFTVVYDGTSATLTVTDTLNSFGAAGFTTAMTNVADIRHILFGTRQYPGDLQARFDDVKLIYWFEPTPPNAVTDLTATATDWFQMNLTWTAPLDPMYGDIVNYNLRYSTSQIIDEATFSAATPLTPTPPAPAGTVQTRTITGLAPATTYYYAIKSSGASGMVSPISNVATGSTLPMDVTLPATINDLAATTIKPNFVVLTWTAVGDDGMAGKAVAYDLRYSTSPIYDDVTFADATAVSGLAAPANPGSTETLRINGLTPDTTYYFAIKARDEATNWSALGTILTVLMPVADLSAPNAITDVAAIGGQGKAVLTWTAPADVGSTGVVGYYVRYSTSPIDETNWTVAIPAANLPAPAEPGTRQSLIIDGLQSSTKYYFAIKSYDEAEPVNVSALSNVPFCTTRPPVGPVAVHNPWLVNDRVADTHNINTMGTTYVNAYTPDGVVPPASDEAKAINIYDNQKRRLYHWASEAPGMGGYDTNDPTYNQNVFGWCLCGRHASQACTITQAAGLTPRKIMLPGHWIYEVQYGGQWHAYDTMTTMYVYSKTNPRHVASCSEMASDSTLMLNARPDGRACPGFLLCGDDPVWFQGVMRSASDSGSGVVAAIWNGNMNLRAGQSFTRTCESWLNQHPTSTTNADSAPGMDPPYHHEANKDWKDTVNSPYWEPYNLTIAEMATLNIPMSPTYRRWANGTDTLAPNFRDQTYQSMVHSSSSIATNSQDGLSPDLHPASVGVTSEVVFKIDVPYYVTDATFSGDFVKTNAGDICSVFTSKNGTTWTPAWAAPGLGTIHVANQSLRTAVFATWSTWYIKIQLKSTVAKGDAGVSNFVVVTTFEHNKGAMAYLDKGVNTITLTFDNPADLLASGNVLRVLYKWKEFDGANWTISKQFETFATASPTTFTITTAGTKVPRTELITMEVVPPPVDPYAPGAVTDLAAGAAQASKVPLTWTASGDDGNTGAASAYDIRYSTTPITDDATFAAATAVTGAPSPLPAGTAQSFTVTGLSGSTTYWFALKVRDKGGNTSELSNVVTATTTPPDLVAPQSVTNLHAMASKTSGGVDLTWTAPADYGALSSGPFTSAGYDLRYSTSPITDQSSFSAATAVPGLAAPKTPGQNEAFTVTGLTGGTTYYFAIKAIDDAANIAALSNSASAAASILGEKIFQVGLNGYIASQDTYAYASSPTSNYSTLERMTVTGYGPANYQHGFIKFDLSGLPTGASVVSAKLYLYAYDPSQSKGTSGFYGLYPITRTWADTQVSWNNALTSAPWTTPGGDFDPMPDATAPKQAPTLVPCWYSWDVTSRVQAWMSAPATNNGWVVRVVNEAMSVQDRFYQSDTANAALRPMLVISDVASGDTVAPAAVTNLAAADNSDGSIHLTWTATGDDGTTGTATSYELRYRTEAQGAITAANWSSSTVIGIPAPAAAGTPESVAVVALASRQGYHFALKVTDENFNTSGLSNVAYAWLEPGPRTVVLEPSKDGPMYGLTSGSGNSNRGYGGRFDLNGADATRVDSVVMKFDMTEVLGNHERIASAMLDLYATKTVAGAVYNMDVQAYPLLVDWVEGTGTNSGVVGSVDWPWGPAQIGDTVYNYRQVTATGTDSTFGNMVVASAGVPWAVPGARGIGVDISDDVMISQNIAGTGYSQGQNLCHLTVTPTGVRVVNDWARGRRTNHGFSLFPLNGGTGGIPLATREFPTPAAHPQLRLSVVPTVNGDINCDGYVNIGDLQLLVAAWAATAGPPASGNWNAQADINSDGMVSVVDLQMLVVNWGASPN